MATIVAYLKEVESPYEVLDFIRSYLGDTMEAKAFAKQFLERRAKQKANHQRQQQQVCVLACVCVCVCLCVPVCVREKALTVETSPESVLGVDIDR